MKIEINQPNSNAQFYSKTPVTFKGKAEGEIVTVKLTADERWDIGSDDVDAQGFWSMTYPGFHQTGIRKITVIGFDKASQKKADASINILVSTGVEKIIQVAANSELALYNWLNRGVAPRGYINGMAVVYARVYCKLQAGDAIAQEMAKANTNNTNKDALSHYAQKFQNAGMDNNSGGVNTLRHLFVLLIGLGMRESSGRYCEGRDKSSTNTTAETAEAGLFQTSYNARNGSSLMVKLFEQYLDNPSGFEEIFKEEVTCSEKDWENFGEGKGKDFQRLSKVCPAFAAEFAAVGLRNLRKHWGRLTAKKLKFVLKPMLCF